MKWNHMSGSCEPSCKQATRAAIPSSLLVRPFLYSPHGLTALGPFDPPPYSLYWFFGFARLSLSAFFVLFPFFIMPPGAAPYTKTLSALCKTELVRLSREFRLPTEGSVVVLRNRLKVYLNAHNEVLYRNPRFNALYPKHRRIQHQPVVAPQRSPSPALSEKSFDSWHGIGADRPRSPSLPARPPQRSRSPTPPQSPPQHYDYLPPPSNDGLPFQDRQPVVAREFVSPFGAYSTLCLLFATSLLLGHCCHLVNLSFPTLFCFCFLSGLLCDNDRCSPPILFVLCILYT